MNKKITEQTGKSYFWLLIIVGLICLGIAGYVLFLHETNEENHFAHEKMVLGVERSFLTAAVWVAEKKGYFEEEGLNVTLKEFDSGKAALSAMLTGEGLDMVTVAQTPIVLNSFTNEGFVIISAMVTSDNDIKLLARKDKGLQKYSDLSGKKVGVTKGSSGEYYLSLFLTHSGIDLSEVDVINILASELPQALANGSVDAICTWEPNILKAKKLLGENAVLLLPKGGLRIYREDFYFTSNKGYATRSPEAIQKFLRAIKKGNNLIRENREEAISIISKRLKTEEEHIASVWNDFHFQLLLDQYTFTSLKNEAKWAIKNNLTDKTEAPDYSKYLFEYPLLLVAPEAVSLYY